MTIEINDVPVDTLLSLVRMKRGLEDIQYRISPPHAPTGYYYLDLILAEKHCTVMYKEGSGYGLCFKHDDNVLSNSPDEVVHDVHLAADKIYDFFLR